MAKFELSHKIGTPILNVNSCLLIIAQVLDKEVPNWRELVVSKKFNTLLGDTYNNAIKSMADISSIVKEYEDFIENTKD